MRQWIDHTSEVELEIDAASEQEVLAEALAGLAELLGEPRAEASPLSAHDVDADGRDLAALLVAWLEALLWLAERESVVPERVERMELVGEPPRCRARVLARPGPPRPIVKGVTWHDLRFEPCGDRFHARVVLDV